jgi:hypothetical protein
MEKLIIPLVAVALFVVAIGIYLQKTGIVLVNSTPAPSVTLSVNDNTVNVEPVITAEQRAKGLSGRSSLDPNSGMLFVFTKDDKAPTFWMKDMLISLDIIWIKDGKIIKIDKNVPAPTEGTPDSKLNTYSAGASVDYVLEVNSGFTDSHSIKVGDTVTVSGL